jgi:hypothetical protein
MPTASEKTLSRFVPLPTWSINPKKILDQTVIHVPRSDISLTFLKDFATHITTAQPTQQLQQRLPTCTSTRPPCKSTFP